MTSGTALYENDNKNKTQAYKSLEDRNDWYCNRLMNSDDPEPVQQPYHYIGWV